jgi:hypothetical protein
MRASRKDIGKTLGSVIFRGKATSHGIQRKLAGASQTRLEQAMEHRGLSGVTKKEIGDVLTGKDRAGWSSKNLKKAVEVLQDVGIASKKETASSMVMRVSQSAAGQGGVKLKEVLTATQYKRHMQEQSRERREEAEEEEKKKKSGSVSVLDRMRGDMGRANKPTDAAAAETAPAGTNIRETREALREQIALRPSIVLPKPVPSSPAESGADSPSSFQV